MFEVRELFEVRAAKAFAKQQADAPAWESLRLIEKEHRHLLARIKTRYHDFSDLDERFHRLVSDASRNRFIADFHDVISLIFHYHYQWNKRYEKERNIAAIHEHLAYIEALQSRDRSAATAGCRSHMTTARLTLMDSIRHFESRI